MEKSFDKFRIAEDRETMFDPLLYYYQNFHNYFLYSDLKRVQKHLN